MMRDDMRKEDRAFFSRSSCKEPGIVGLMRIVSRGYEDDTQFDPDSKYYDAKSDPDNPRWLMADVSYQQKLKRTISLTELKAQPALKDFSPVRRGNRLSVLPVSEADWAFILGLE